MEEDLKEMLGKRPDELEGETLKLFNAIMKIADERDELKLKCKELEEIEESHRKENGELRERVKELEEWNEYYRKEMLSKEYIKLNYIPKSKVEEKIVELNKQLEEDLQDEIKVNSNRFIIICQCKNCLQELLEGRKI